MCYLVRTIHSEEEIYLCEEFKVSHFLWNSRQQPETAGRMGYIGGKGLFISMTCKEQNPLTRYTHDMDPVCKDSAMEAFFAFPHSGVDRAREFVPYNDCLYLNFEVNSRGAVYAKYGWGRKARSAFPKEIMKQCNFKACVEKDHWSISFLLPNVLLLEVYQINNIENIDCFWCNFYKISEEKAIEHYGAYHPVESVTPNFHLPEFFAKAVLE